MLLSDGEIREAVASGELLISPFDPTSDAVQPASVDLRLRPDLQVQSDAAILGIALDPEVVNVSDHLARYTDLVDISSGWDFKPGGFVLGRTMETIGLPWHLAGRVEGRSRLARLGVGVHVTAPKTDPGFHNSITLEIYNLGPWTLRLRAGMKICSLSVERLGRTAEHGYAGMFQGRRPAR